MKVSYHNDSQPGYGTLVNSQLSFVAGEIHFMLKRSSDRKCLSPSGWQEAEVNLKPVQFHWIDDDLHIKIGPPVVDHLDMQEGYRLYLLFADGSTNTAGFRAEGVVYSPLSGGQGIAPAPTVPAAPPTAPMPEPKPAPTLESIAATEAELSPEIAIDDDYLSFPQPVPRKKNLITIIALLALICIVVGIVAYIFYKPSTEPDVPPLRQAYEHLAKENISAEDSLKLGQNLQRYNSNDAHDAAFLLYEDAAQKGNSQAMMLMAAYYDPTDTAPNGSIIKDAEQALSWYEKALQAGQQNAGDKISQLKKWMEENAKP